MLFSAQAVVLATLALDGAFAQPAHRHTHKHRRELDDVLGKREPQVPAAGSAFWNNPDNYKDPATGQPLTDAQRACVFAGNDISRCPASGSSTSSSSNTPVKVENKEAVGQAAASPAASSSPSSASSAPASASSSSGGSSSGSGSCVDINQVWSKGDPSSNPGVTSVGQGPWTDNVGGVSKRATAAQDGYVGNVGGATYGRNIIPLSDCNDQNHPYTIKFTNSYDDKRDMSVAIWNKVGSDKAPQSGPSSKAFFYIDLPAGKSASFAFQKNSQIAFSEASSTCKRQSGAPGDWYCIWGEANFGLDDGGNSSYDASTMLDPAGVPGELTVSMNGQNPSSRSVCGFTKAGQVFTGQGTGQTCSPQAPNDKMNLLAEFGKK